MPPTEQTDQPEPPDERDEGDAPTSDADDPTAIAEDGMAPLINNTGVDGGEDDDADASSG